MAKEDANESVPSPLPSPSQIPSVLKTTKNNSIESKRVSFSQAEDKENVFRPTLDGKRATRSATFGKANPLRDLGVFMAIIFFFFFVASSLQSFGKIDTGEEVIQNQGSLGRFRQMRNALSTMLQHELHQNPVRLDCDLLLTKSTIPRTGFGVFAGRNYTQGEPIVSIHTIIAIAYGSSIPCAIETKHFLCLAHF